jgi:hypothetical protein
MLTPNEVIIDWHVDNEEISEAGISSYPSFWLQGAKATAISS